MQHLCHRAVRTFGCAVCLWVIRRREVQLSAEELMELPLENAGEQSIAIANDAFQQAMELVHMLKDDLCNFGCPIRLHGRHKVYHRC